MQRRPYPRALGPSSTDTASPGKARQPNTAHSTRLPNHWNLQHEKKKKPDHVRSPESGGIYLIPPLPSSARHVPRRERQCLRHTCSQWRDCKQKKKKQTRHKDEAVLSPHKSPLRRGYDSLCDYQGRAFHPLVRFTLGLPPLSRENFSTPLYFNSALPCSSHGRSAITSSMGQYILDGVCIVLECDIRGHTCW